MRSLLSILIGLLLARLLQGLLDVAREDRDRWLGMWAFLTVAAFFSLHFLVFSVVVAGTCVWAMKKMPDRVPSIYVVLLPLMPTYGYTIEGAFGISKILDLEYTRVLSLVLVVPAYFAARAKWAKQPAIRHAADFFFVGYCVWLVVISMVHSLSVTDTARIIVEIVLFLLVPYLAVSRLIRNYEDLRDVMTALAFTGIVVAGISIIEVLVSQHLYTDLLGRLRFNHVDGFAYIPLYRFGFLRVHGSLTGGIGLFLVLGLGALMCLAQMQKIPRWRLWAGMAFMLFPIFCTGSRGTWIMAGMMLVIRLFFRFVSTPFRYFSALVAAYFVIPYAQSLILGAKDEFGTFSYREDLLASSLPLVWEKALLGWGGLLQVYSTGRLDHLIQGEGIIDMVNTYLGEALQGGVPQVVLFAGILFFSVMTPLRRLGKLPAAEAELARPVVIWIASIVPGIAFLQVTTSLVGHTWAYMSLAAAIACALGTVPLQRGPVTPATEPGHARAKSKK